MGSRMNTAPAAAEVPTPEVVPVLAELVSLPPTRHEEAARAPGTGSGKPAGPADRAAGDPVVQLHQSRADNRRLRGRLVAAYAAFAFLLFVSVLQFVGTFVTCNIL